MHERLDFTVRIPFVEALGVELWRFEGGHAELRMDLAESHTNSFAVAHGGVLMTLLDVAMAHAARSVHARMPGADHGVVTIEMKTSFVRPAEGRLRCEGRLLHRTTTLAFCEGSLFDAADHLCAHATGTFKYLRALPTGGRTTRPLQRTTHEPPP
jgi:uncharacterized protein (TIGR00369 family)